MRAAVDVLVLASGPLTYVLFRRLRPAAAGSTPAPGR